MRLRCSHRAFSLVELTVAVAVLVFGIYGVYEQFIAIRIPSQQRLLLAQARGLAHQKLEELRACSYEELKNWKPGTAFQRIEGQPRFSSRAEIQPGPDQTLEIKIQLAWDLDDGKQEPIEGKVVTAKGLRAP